MKKYVCSICGYIYEEAKGLPQAGYAPGTKWADLPGNWVCPVCGASKSAFVPQEEKAAPAERTAVAPAEFKELSALEMSVLCSNLARGCEKQYKAEESALFRRLGEYFLSISAPEENPSTEKLLALVEKDLKDTLPEASAAAESAGDRGALRALTWSGKVTRILESLLTRYEKEGNSMTAGTGVWVCTICGFIWVGDQPPALCPVCKVPGWKFEKMEGSVQ